MPVQDNDDKRTSDQPVVDAEEELRKQQAKAQEHQKDETNVQKSGKLLPFLNAMTYWKERLLKGVLLTFTLVVL